MDINELRARLLIEAADILSEGAVKTSKKKKLDNYLAKYGYKGDKKKGTIEINGTKYIVDRDVNSKTMTYSDGDKDVRHVMATYSTSLKNSERVPTIYLDKNFEKLKNNKRRDAVLNHEIGHYKTRNDPEREKMLNGGKYDDEITDKDEKIKNKSHKHDKNVEEASKKEYQAGSHQNAKEYLADAYASANKNGEHSKRALREIHKNNKNPDKIRSDYKTVDKFKYEKLKSEGREKEFEPKN